MRINNVKINAYGKLKNKSLDFSNDINVIKGDNESGKSTLLNCITDIFYGISKNKEGKDISDFEKYKPWTGEAFSGKIRYTLDNENEYEVFRDFKNKNPKIYNDKMEEISSKFSVDKKEGNRFFFEQTGVDKKMYLSTVVSMQESVRLEEQDQNSLVQKIANIAGTGKDNISYKKANEKLQKKIKDEIGTSRTAQRPINLLKNRLEEINTSIENISKYEDRKYQINTEKEKLKYELNLFREKKEIAVKFQTSEHELDGLKQKLRILKENEDENHSKIKALAFNKEEIEKEKIKIEETIKKQNNIIEQNQSKKSTNSYKNVEKKELNITKLVIINIILFLIIIANYIILKNLFVFAAIPIIFIIELILFRIPKQAKKGIDNELDKIEKENENINKNIEELIQEKNITNEKIAEIQGKIDLLEENNNVLQRAN